MDKCARCVVDSSNAVVFLNISLALSPVSHFNDISFDLNFNVVCTRMKTQPHILAKKAFNNFHFPVGNGGEKFHKAAVMQEEIISNDFRDCKKSLIWQHRKLSPFLQFTFLKCKILEHSSVIFMCNKTVFLWIYFLSISLWKFMTEDCWRRFFPHIVGFGLINISVLREKWQIG